MEHLHTTICALATPPGEGGIATVRVSGPDAYGIVGKIFAPVRQGKTHRPAGKPHRNMAETISRSTKSWLCMLSATNPSLPMRWKRL